MKRFLLFFFLILSVLVVNDVFANLPEGSCRLTGVVKCKGEVLPFANVVIKGTTLGTVTNESGRFSFCNLSKGSYTIVVSSVGYKTVELPVKVKDDERVELSIELEEDLLQLDEVVVSADRGMIKRTQAPVMVNTISPTVFNSTQSAVAGEALNFMPGLRLENDCQNCGFNQVRMNGLEGPYSQILINSRPIFSGLASVYGLELLPSNMIERIEVVRGGGSVLYGSNAIAGTINIILKDAVANSYEVGFSSSGVGFGLKDANGPIPDFSLNFNNTLVAADNRTGITVYGFNRDRSMFDANGDGFSELAPLSNFSMGTRIWQKLGDRGKISVDFFGIREKRDGGNKQAYPLHERDVAEAVKHDLRAGSLLYERYFRHLDLFSFFVSAQYLNRDSYYGANKSLSSYGKSRDITFNAGMQYKAILGLSTLTFGSELTGSNLNDKKLAYRDISNPIFEIDTQTGDTLGVNYPQVDNTTVSDQGLLTYGVFAQHDLSIGKLKTSLGLRLEQYRVVDYVHEDNPDKNGLVLVPRVSLMYNATEWMQARVSYSQGYRTPQIFDEDLHVETSGARQVINRNDPDLKQETSHSFMFSLDINKQVGRNYIGFLTELFYTRLQDPFVNEIGTPDENGVVVYTRRNAPDGATVKGFNMEGKFKSLKDFSVTAGFTLQSSLYDVPQEFGERKFFRTPSQYGYLILDWDFMKGFCLSVSGTYTGSMLAPYFGPNTNMETGELRETQEFFDMNLKLSYDVDLNGKVLRFFGGVKNIFNSYQSDFDMGINRDPSYIYGPTNPRTIFVGVKFGNLLR
ncbi:TonB-dependent receptor [Tenuifilum thalassicum]|uniref:TonB-dependent receptor n=1 Tax=Tenuifilum thalassicum TaxID=2590900 RepID=A0A7D3XF36_9BACT|nr:TonB-dependent receptor [Tenuifilum thalassicum]QKG80467.1 TonB-dependent receptor [Tenuifilum thalassicum]